MIGWAGFIAKLLEFVLSKVINHRVDWTLNENKRVAQTAVDLVAEIHGMELEWLKDALPFQFLSIHKELAGSACVN